MYGDIFVLDAPYLQGKSSNGWWLSAPRALSSSLQVLYRLFSWPAAVSSSHIMAQPLKWLMLIAITMGTYLMKWYSIYKVQVCLRKTKNR